MSTTAPQTEQDKTYVNGDPVEGDTAPAPTPPVVEPEPEPSPAEPTPDDVSEHDTQLDDIEKQVAHREWTVAGDFNVVARDGSQHVQPFERTYIQKPLSYTAMLQFTGLIGEKISEAMAGPEGLTIDGVVGEAQDIVGAGRSVFSRDDFSGVDTFVKGLAKLSMYIPDVIEDCQCIWLRVPIAERGIVKEIWSRSPEDGGLSMADGEEMLDVFLSQNYAEVEDFFVVRLRRLLDKVNRIRTKREASRSALTPPLKR